VTAAVEKAQQDPHCPWFLTAWTAPLVTQLTSPTDSGNEATGALDFYGATDIRYVVLNSSLVKSVN